MNLYRRYGWELTLAALLVLEILLFGLSNSRMLDINVLLFSTSDFICIGIVALPLTMVIVSGGIDISFGSTIGLCAIFLGIVFQAGVPMSVAIPLTVLVGALCGLINAGLILYTGVNPLVITLGTLYLFGGSALLLSGLSGATGYEGIGGFPAAFTDFANQTLFGLPIPLVIFMLCAAVLAADAPYSQWPPRVPDWAKQPSRPLQRPAHRPHLMHAVCHDRGGLSDCRHSAGVLFRLRTL